MRLWEEDYEGNVSAKTLNMEDANKLMKEKDKYPIWLKMKVKYILLIMKMENISCMERRCKFFALKSRFSQKYKLAGIASWRKGFETKDIWPMINKRLQK